MHLKTEQKSRIRQSKFSCIIYRVFVDYYFNSCFIFVYCNMMCMMFLLSSSKFRL